MGNRNRRDSNEVRKELVRNAETISNWKQLYVEDLEEGEDLEED